MTRRTTELTRPRGRCLTEFGVPLLAVGALAMSAVLWFAIYAVI